MKTVLVTGSNGLLGQKLTDLYLKEAERVQLIASGTGPDRYPLKGAYRYVELDVTSQSSVDEAVDAIAPQCIIHTAAMTNVDLCENEQEKCYLLNVTAVRHLVNAANRVGAHLVHLSTDFIFDGSRGPYREEDTAGPLSFYGRSKLEAESIIRSEARSWAIARTVLVYGLVADMSRSNIVLWAKSALESGGSVRAVADQYRTPTLAEDLALGCKLIEEQQASGLFNISGEDFMSIYELVHKVAGFWHLPAENIEKVASADLNQAAPRPPVTGFIIEKARKELGYIPHSFEEGLKLLDKQLKERSRG